MTSRDEFARICFDLKQAKARQEDAERDLAKAMDMVNQAKASLAAAKKSVRAAQASYDKA